MRKIFAGEKFDIDIDRINLIQNTSDYDIARNFLMRCIDAEFGSKLGNVNHTRQRAIVELIIKGESIKFYSIGSSHRRLVLEKYFNLNKNLIYIDNPFILDDINEIIYIYTLTRKIQIIEVKCSCS